jgi:hypothetical protein
MNNKKLDVVHVWKKSEEGRAEARPYKAQTTTTRDKKVDAKLVWKQMEDLLAPQLHFSLADRVIYSHLFRHSRLEGKLQLQFSIPDNAFALIEGHPTKLSSCTFGRKNKPRSK